MTRRPRKRTREEEDIGPSLRGNTRDVFSASKTNNTSNTERAVNSRPAPGLPDVFVDRSIGKGDQEPQTYASMAGKIDARLLKGLESMGYEFMTPVQKLVLTQLPTLKSDCLVRAKTGTGKTIAFMLPTLQSLLNASPPLPHGQVGILVITPTRELALQIKAECDRLTAQMPRPFECHTAFGGTARASNLNRFMRGAPAILVATPGRLLDYLSDASTAARFSKIQTVVLDEADTMLEQGFIKDVREILRLLPPKSTGWQGMCFSATVPEKIKDVVECVLQNYISLSTVDRDETPTIDLVPQYHIVMPTIVDTFNTLASLVDRESRNNSKILVFGITANLVALFANVFSQGLTPLHVYELHSRLSQSTRTKTTAEFKAAKAGILFASDVVGRGMDFPNVDLVVQVGLPSSADQYIHRVGRTGRATNSGRAVLLLTQSETFFLSKNPHLPIQPYAQSEEILSSAPNFAPHIEQAMNQIDEKTKQRAYSSILGWYAGSGVLKNLRLDKPGLVAMVNEWAVKGMHCPEPPGMEKKTIGKMGLKGVPGINYVAAEAGGGGRVRNPQAANGSGRGDSRRQASGRGMKS